MRRVVLGATAVGLALHQIFRRREPSPSGAAITLLCADAALYGLLARLGDLPLTHSALVVLAIAGATIVGSLLLSIAAYRLSPWHPLARIPGPWDYKLTKLRVAYSAWHGNHYKNVKKLHDKYGPVVRVGPNEVSVADVAAVSGVLGATNGLPKDRYYRARASTPDGTRTVINLTGTEHAHRRRLWNRGFGQEQLISHSQIAKTELDHLLKQLDKAAVSQTVVDMTMWIRFYGFDFMGSFVFGEDFGLLKKGADPEGFITTTQKFTGGLDMTSHLYWLGNNALLLPGMTAALIRFRDFARRCVHTRLERGMTTLDLWYYLASETEDVKEKLSFATLAREGTLAIVAGSDTSASTMVCAVYMLANNPSCYARARAEVDAAVVNGLNPWTDSMELQKTLPYLTACMDETLRLMPVVPTNGSRGVPPGSGGKALAGHLIPENTEVYVSPYILHTDERYFSPATMEFRPERWLESGWNTNRAAFIPFSYGPAQCVGKNLARIEIVMVLSALLHRYDMSFAPGYDPAEFPEHLEERLVVEVPRLPIALKRRKL